VLRYLGRLARDEGDFATAQARFRESLRAALAVGDQGDVAVCLLELAIVAALRGLEGHAARLAGAAAAVRHAAGLPRWPPEGTWHDPRLAAERDRLGAAAWDVAWDEGRALSPDEVLALAQGPVLAPEKTARLVDAPAGLTAREAEVLRLVSLGLTDAQVADRLALSPRTVGQHLRSVYNKLGVDNRTAAARLAVERGLA